MTDKVSPDAIIQRGRWILGYSCTEEDGGPGERLFTVDLAKLDYAKELSKAKTHFLRWEIPPLTVEEYETYAAGLAAAPDAELREAIDTFGCEMYRAPEWVRDLFASTIGAALAGGKEPQ